MITTVTGKHQITIPAKLAHQLGIAPGSRLQWQAGAEPGTVSIRILPDRRTLANTLLGAGRVLRAKTSPPATL